MHRDFSDKSKVELLSLVDQVEGEKKSDFTDWVGDRWYDFQEQIGLLNIEKHIGNVNKYHKKVIDKNNATKKNIENIFKDVKEVDSEYEKKLNIYENELDKWKKYLEELNAVINPQKGTVDLSNSKNKLNEILKEINTLKDKESNEKAKTFWEEFWQEYGWSGLLAGSGDIKKIYKLFNEFKNAESKEDYIKAVQDLKDYIENSWDTFKKYKKIGNAVGSGKAMSWWGKKVLGFKPLGRTSTVKGHPITRFKRNLTNKTSPFNAQIKNIVNNFTGKNGVKKTVASWGGVILDGALNFISNKEEQKASNGAMSDQRVIEETVTETVVGTVLGYGASIVVGAAIAALSPVAVPGILVTAATGMVLALVNAGVKHITEKSTTEWISDAVLYGKDKALEKAGSAVKKAKSCIGTWFGQLVYA